MPAGASLKSLRVTNPSTRRFPGRSSATTSRSSLCSENKPSRSRSAAYTERTSGISSSSFSARPNSWRKSSACIRTPTRNTITIATTSPMPVWYHWSGINSSTCLPKNCSRIESTQTTKYRVAIRGSTVSSPVRKIRTTRFHGELRFGTVHRIIGGGGSSDRRHLRIHAGRWPVRRLHGARRHAKSRPRQGRRVHLARALREHHHQGQVPVAAVLARRGGGAQMAQPAAPSRSAGQGARRNLQVLPPAHRERGPRLHPGRALTGAGRFGEGARVDHTFIFKEGSWRSEGEYCDAAGTKFALVSLSSPRRRGPSLYMCRPNAF